MATIHKWGTLASKATVLSSSQLNNLADAGKAMSAAISNDTLLYIYADFRLHISTQTANRTANAYVGLHILTDLGDSTFADSNLLDANSWLGNFILDSGATTARNTMIWNAVIPPSNFKILVSNETGVIFTSCSKLEYRRYYLQST